MNPFAFKAGNFSSAIGTWARWTRASPKRTQSRSTLVNMTGLRSKTKRMMKTVSRLAIASERDHA